MKTIICTIFAFSTIITYSQSFNTPVANPFGISASGLVSQDHFSSFGDLDNDGDQDLIISDFDGVFKYYENIGSATAPNFDAPINNPFGITVVDYSNCSCNSMQHKLVDLDSDGDLDLFVMSWYGATYFYAENIGTVSSPNFDDLTEGLSWMPASFIYGPYPGIDLVDIDADGDLDLFTCEQDRLCFRENEGSSSSPSFSSSLETDAFGVNLSGVNLFPTFNDIDGDGDYDMFVGGNSNGLADFQFYENIGTASSPVFDSPIENPFNLENSNISVPSLTFVDLDGDSDLDIFVGGKISTDLEFQYYERGGVTGILNQDSSLEQLYVFPNLAPNSFRIRFKL